MTNNNYHDNNRDLKVMSGEQAQSSVELALMESQSALEVKLKHLRDAYEQGFIDEIAYSAKRLEIEGLMQAFNQCADTEEKLIKLQHLLDAGILAQGEFEMKRSELIHESSHSEMEVQISKLNAALACGILTQEEYEIQKLAIKQKSELSNQIK
ncbi:hypothetical protein NIES2107_44420 [Nostoc carneum NIES-2107]|nr:hypothetical protein NIES2107_44420 [Nostoc carneum NIES-2107]